MPQDYSGQNLRGRSFKGQNLEGANFTGADIRSADFTNSILVGANFTGAKAGLQKRWAAFLLVASFVLSGISAYFPALIGTIIAHLFVTTSSDLANLILGTIILFLLIIFFITISRQGLNLAENFAQVFAVGFFFGFLALISGGDFANAIPISFAVGVTFAGVFAAATAFTFAGAFATAIATAITATFSEVVTFAGVFTAAGVLTYILYVGERYIFDGIGSFTYAYAVGSFVGSGSVALLSCYIARQSLKGDEKYTVIWKATIFIAAIGGTNFYNANLTNADFTEAILKSTDFREAILTRTCFYETKKLDRVRPGRTYLQKKQLQDLVITRDGKNKNFDHLDLRGLNLREADLENASFIDADFYEANLQGANLSRAILVRTNFERADLRNAKLTGSCIQDWVISRVTKLDGIVCDYVYLKWVDGDKRDQMPHRDTFKRGGFVFFVKYILDTIEIYHNKDINPRLALSVLKKMSRDYNEPLDIVAVGKRGDKVFMKLKLSENVEPEQFKEDYFSRYDDLKLISSSSKALPSVDEVVENRLAEIASDRTDEISSVNVTYIEYIYTPKDVVIQGEVIVETIEAGGDTISQSGSFGVGVNKGEIKNVGQVGFMSNNPGGFSVGGSIGGNINNVQGDNNKVVQGDTTMTGNRNINTGGGNYNERIQGDYVQGNYYAAGQPQSLAKAVGEIQQLLEQLDKSYPSNTTTGKMTVAVETIKQIDANPDLATRILSALKAGGISSFEQFLNHPAASFVIGALEDWQKSKGTQV